MRTGFYYQSSRKDLTNFAFLRHLKYSGFLVSMHQSGTHWLKYLLAVAIAKEYCLPMPQYNHANDIIGGPKDPRLYDNAPRLASSHSIPHPLLKLSIFRTMVKLPLYVVLIRDIRNSLISNYEKWRNRYNCSFSEFLRGNIRRRRFNNDIWWCIRFMNAWGRLIEKYPNNHLLVKYEDLTNDTLAQANRINNFWGLGIREDFLNFAIQEATKDKMLLKHDPDRPAGEVRTEIKTFEEFTNEDDRVFFYQTCTNYLDYRFGYKYTVK
jgi:hypothetical protein